MLPGRDAGIYLTTTPIRNYILEIGSAQRDSISSVSRVGVLGVMGGVTGIVIAPDGLQKGGEG